MLVKRNLLLVKQKHLGGLLVLTFISIICVAFSMTGNDDFDFARREILLRRIGHEILLQSGDSTSRVLPVKKIAGNEYQISFENAFTFQPEFLVNTTRRLLAEDPLASDYVVNVLNCANASVAYGYGISTAKKEYFLGGMLFLAFVGFIFLRPFKPRRILPESGHAGLFTLGSMSF